VTRLLITSDFYVQGGTTRISRYRRYMPLLELNCATSGGVGNAPSTALAVDTVTAPVRLAEEARVSAEPSGFLRIMAGVMKRRTCVHPHGPLVPYMISSFSSRASNPVLRAPRAVANRAEMRMTRGAHDVSDRVLRVKAPLVRSVTQSVLKIPAFPRSMPTRLLNHPSFRRIVLYETTFEHWRASSSFELVWHSLDDLHIFRTGPTAAALFSCCDSRET